MNIWQAIGVMVLAVKLLELRHQQRRRPVHGGSSSSGERSGSKRGIDMNKVLRPKFAPVTEINNFSQKPFLS